MQAKIWNFSGWISECDPVKLREHYNELLKEAGFTILNTLEHFFNPFGYTALFLLCESHFAIHTFPEAGRAYIELSSCNEEFYNKAVQRLRKELI